MCLMYLIVQLLSCVQLCNSIDCRMQASLSFTNSGACLNMSIKLVMLSNHLILCCPLLLLSVFFFFKLPFFFFFLRSQFFTSDGQSIGASSSGSVLPMNIQAWFPLGLTRLVSLQSKGLSRVSSNTIVQKHQFFGAQLSLWSISHIQTWLLEKLYLWLNDLCWQSNVSAF